MCKDWNPSWTASTMNSKATFYRHLCPIVFLFLSLFEKTSPCQNPRSSELSRRFPICCVSKFQMNCKMIGTITGSKTGPSWFSCVFSLIHFVPTKTLPHIVHQNVQERSFKAFSCHVLCGKPLGNLVKLVTLMEVELVFTKTFKELQLKVCEQGWAHMIGPRVFTYCWWKESC